VSRIHPVIMAGGRGTRFWPASREASPKQFLTVDGGDSLLRRTGRRLAPLAEDGRVWIVTNAAHVALAAEHLPETSPDRIVGEPVGRNTAPCAALAAALVAREDPEGVVLLAPADHWIGDEEAFRRAARLAADTAHARRALVTFGVVPTSPETGYGYIEAGEEVAPGVREVVRFTEKPDRPTAETFLASGSHYWNSGIFAWRADTFLEELSAHHPAMVDACRAIAAADPPDRAAALDAGYARIESISVDYALLERSERVLVVPAEFPWSDIGSWNALADLRATAGADNVTEGDVVAIDSRGCYVRSSGRLAAVLGMSDLVVVDTPDALLVCPKSRAQDVKAIVEALEERGRTDLL
jgi:mannose-1-phosphate guanylyltransferase/mannose-6-phosphate isomerase